MASPAPSGSPPLVIYSCTDEQMLEVTELVGDSATAAIVCSQYDCSFTAVSCVLKYLAAQQADLSEQMDGTAKAEVALSLDVAFLLFSAYLVFGPMQLGFALLCAGAIRSKNSMNVLMKNILDACTGAIGFYLFGYAFAFGHHANQTSNAFIGDHNFALSYTTQVSSLDSNVSYDGFATQGWHVFFFQWSFCAAATTIVSGAVAERCTFQAYLAYAFFISSFVYPVVVHWVWSASGWLSAFNTSRDGYALLLQTGAIDFAGGGVVHLTGGMAALMGAWIIGPRIGRFDASGKVNEMKGHSATLVVMGTFLLWFGFYGFNPGSNLTIATTASAIVVSRVAVTTTLSAGAAGLTGLFWRYMRTSTWDTVLVCNCCLAGLVGITCSCSVVEPWAALICGFVAAFVFIGFEYVVLYKMKIDDPVSAVALHLFCGVWGLLFPGLLAQPTYVADVYGAYGFGPDVKGSKKFGILYGGHGQVLLCQVIEALSICAWVGVMMGAFFGLLKVAKRLRVPVDQELAGLDVSKHTNEAYNGAIMPTAGGGAGGGGGYGSNGGERGSGFYTGAGPAGDTSTGGGHAANGGYD
uniref:Ammonium transporter n=1 Tax=Chlamydomonas reinhardtii TaxID=3055 RepID=Q8LRM5_CHLRE|nr:putative amt protein [Chlamydomonas reinhardtii]